MKKVLALALAFIALLPACLWATPAKPALEVVVLGSGGPRAFGRAGSGYVVVVDGTPRILVDAGPGAFLRIGELQLDVEKVDTVLLTHLHIDHSSDLPAFLNDRALTSDGPSSIESSARMEADCFRRLRDLSICWWEMGTLLRIKRRLPRGKRLRCAIWQFAWIRLARRLWMRAGWWWRKLLLIMATVLRWLTVFRIRA